MPGKGHDDKVRSREIPNGLCINIRIDILILEDQKSSVIILKIQSLLIQRFVTFVFWVAYMDVDQLGLIRRERITLSLGYAGNSLRSAISLWVLNGNRTRDLASVNHLSLPQHRAC